MDRIINTNIYRKPRKFSKSSSLYSTDYNFEYIKQYSQHSPNILDLLNSAYFRLKMTQKYIKLDESHKDLFINNNDLKYKLKSISNDIKRENHCHLDLNSIYGRKYKSPDYDVDNECNAVNKNNLITNETCGTRDFRICARGDIIDKR